MTTTEATFQRDALPDRQVAILDAICDFCRRENRRKPEPPPVKETLLFELDPEENG